MKALVAATILFTGVALTAASEAGSIADSELPTKASGNGSMSFAVEDHNVLDDDEEHGRGFIQFTVQVADGQTSGSMLFGAEHHHARLHHHLERHVGAARPTGASHGELAPPLAGHGDHQVGDADGGHEERHRADESEQDLERVRVLVRGLFWSMNDESGNLIRFAPQAIGEILARVPELLPEYEKNLAAFRDESPFEVMS